MHKHGENKTLIMVATVCQVTSGSGLKTISGCSIFVGQGVQCNFQYCNPNVNCGPTLTIPKVLAGN
jgi:hypothetical protein